VPDLEFVTRFERHLFILPESVQLGKASVSDVKHEVTLRFFLLHSILEILPSGERTVVKRNYTITELLERTYGAGGCSRD